MRALRAGFACPVKAPRCPLLCSPRSRRATVAVSAQRTAEEYATALRECETSGDWTQTLELVTELNILRVAVEPVALESAVVAYAKGGQWQRAEQLYRKLKTDGHAPGSATTTALVAGLAAGQQGDRAAALVSELAAAAGPGAAALGPAQNVVVRALARQGRIDDSYTMLCDLVRAGVPMESSTFTALATCAMNAERTELAEEVLEMRDYL